MRLLKVVALSNVTVARFYHISLSFNIIKVVIMLSLTSGLAMFSLVFWPYAWLVSMSPLESPIVECPPPKVSVENGAIALSVERPYYCFGSESPRQQAGVVQCVRRANVRPFVRPSANSVERYFKNVIWHLLQFHQPNPNTTYCWHSHTSNLSPSMPKNPFDDDGVKIHEKT